MKLILISPSKPKDSEIPLLLHMFEEGLPTYHLRKTKFSTRELKQFISDIPQKYHERIVLHTHHELAIKFHLKGIYITRSHKKNKVRLWLKKKWFKFRNNKIQITTTFRYAGKLYEKNLRYNYVFISPVFDSPSGKSQAGFTENNLRPFLQKTKYKVIARGGVSIDKIQKAHEMGFAGMAFDTAIWKTENPLQEFLKVKEKFAELNLPIE
ncbi:MAG: thiamine phosphate synthase [Bacteroidetes bacterium]|nr:thiamine phosphate synthase [Bacteroidota bacterium]